MGTIYVEGVRKRKQLISRNRNGSGVVRISPDACDLLENIAEELDIVVSATELASKLIKYAAEDNIIKEKPLD